MNVAAESYAPGGCGVGRTTRQLVRLGERVNAVDELVNAECGLCRTFLETCVRHADLVVVEGLPLGWAREDGETTLGEVVSCLGVDRIMEGVVRGAALAEAGLRLGRRMDER